MDICHISVFTLHSPLFSSHRIFLNLIYLSKHLDKEDLVLASTVEEFIFYGESLCSYQNVKEKQCPQLRVQQIFKKHRIIIILIHFTQAC